MANDKKCKVFYVHDCIKSYVLIFRLSSILLQKTELFLTKLSLATLVLHCYSLEYKKF